jgi:hypothetical protein
LWGVTEEAIDVFDELVDLTVTPSAEPGPTQQQQRSLLGFILDDLVGPDDAAARAWIETAPMCTGLSSPAAARTWIVDVLAQAARHEVTPWWDGWDEDGDPIIHGQPFLRLRNRTGLARLILDRRIELGLSQECIAWRCDVVQGEVQKWEAGTRIPTEDELDTLAEILALDRQRLARAEVGSAVHRNPLTPEQQGALDAQYWDSKQRVPDIADQFGLHTATVIKLVNPLPAGVNCERCGTPKVFRVRGDRDGHRPRCLSCARPTFSWNPCTGRPISDDDDDDTWP